MRERREGPQGRGGMIDQQRLIGRVTCMAEADAPPRRRPSTEGEDEGALYTEGRRTKDGASRDGAMGRDSVGEGG